MAFMNSLVPTWVWNGLPHFCIAMSITISDKNISFELPDEIFFFSSLAASFDLNKRIIGEMVK